jgi:hypothetical protein
VLFGILKLPKNFPYLRLNVSRYWDYADVVHCSMLAEDAIKSAIKDYQSKRAKITPTLGPDSPVAVGAT